MLLSIAGLLLVRLPVLWTREFDADEFEHAHAAWSWFGGLVPYKDFFEHHTPWYYYALRPFFNCFDVTASFDSATHFLLFARVLSLVLAALSLWLAYRIGRDWEGPNVGLLAALMFAAQPIFLQKSIEIRPDMLALPFYLAGLWWLLRGLATERLPWFLAAGLAIGGALMSTQKVLFVLPGTLAGLGLWALSARLRVRVLHVAGFMAAVAVPAALTWAAFAAQGAGREFITNNFLLNAGWRDTGTGELAKLLWSSGPVLALALWGLRQTWVHLRRTDSGDRPHGDLLLACTMVGLFAGVAVIPVAYRQYYLLPLPIACLFAARSALSLAERALRWQVVVAVAVMAALPLNTLRESFIERNDRQLARLRHVYDTTGPTDVVLDGWAGTGVFRPHALHHFFLHEEIVAMLPSARRDAYLDALETGAIRPKLIALDGNLVSLGPRFLTFVKAHYATTDGFFYLRRD